MGKGIAVAGNILVDKIKIIDVYPERGMLCNIRSQKLAVGGCVPNTGISLARLSTDIPIFALGRVGGDEEGDFLIRTMSENGMDCLGILRSEDVATSCTDVMTEISTGQRTFFHYRGVNALFSPDDINYDGLNCDIIHIGYALLLDRFDEENERFGNEFSRALYLARQRGIITSMDVVSEQGDRFRQVVSCCLKYCDYITLNEIEAQNVSGIPLRDGNGCIIEQNLPKTCEWFMGQGVGKQVCVHFPEGCAAMDSKGEYRQLPSLELPKGYIKGTVGAGDAFCAGILYSAYKGFSLKESLVAATCAAACNLSAEDSISGMRSFEEAIKLCEIFRYGDTIKEI